MALTKISPALFQVSNNITSVTVGGSANTVSLTFDSNGVITGASNNALSVANTQITGLIEAAQIGSANATLATSGTLPAARLPAGSVLQVVNATNATTTTNSTQTYVDTGLTATITPRSTSSKVLVFVTHASLNKNAGNVANDLKINLCRNAVQIVELVASLGYTATAVQNWLSFSTQYLDSPATTSATTYKTQFANADVAAALVAVNNGGGGSTMTLMEIQG